MDLNKLGETAAETDSCATRIVAGRVLQLDADFSCYECADIEKPAAHNFKNLLDHIEVSRQTAGAEMVYAHITMGCKGGREQMATVKPYQEKRDKHRDMDLKNRVRELREMLANHKTKVIVPVVSQFVEADDTICRMQIERIQTHGIQSTVINSGDKDLWMVPGLHINPKTGKFYKVQGYGKVEYRDVGNKEPKLVGEGTSWFWHQMIMGDQVDNIPGLPMLSGRLAERYLPKKQPDPNRSPLQCGEKKAVAILSDVYSDAVAAQRVFEAYADHYGAEAEERFVEQAFLLWLKRTKDPLDVLVYLRECGLNCTLSAKQTMLMKQYKEHVLWLQQGNK